MVVETRARDAVGPDTLHLQLGIAEVRPPVADLETVLGYPAGRSPEPVQQAIDEILASPADTWAIEGGCVLYHAVTVDTTAHRVAVGDVSFDVGRIVSGQLGRAQGVALFLCTAGRGIEELSRRLIAAGDPFVGYIADAIGSLVVERAMDQVQDRLEARMDERGLRITNRYSPGYCGWNVAEQQKLFRLLPPGFCGVSLTESSLMRPIKSVSGVIGIGAAVRRNPYTCRLCDVDQCLYRRLHAPRASGLP